MKAFPVKLPLVAHARLHLQAERLGAYPSALARALVLQGLDQLEGEVGCWPLTQPGQSWPT